MCVCCVCVCVCVCVCMRVCYSFTQLSAWKEECARLKKRVQEAEQGRDAAERDAAARSATLVRNTHTYAHVTGIEKQAS